MEDITLKLEITGVEIKLRPFVPHGVSTAFQKQLFKGVKGNLSDLQPTKQQLVEKFGQEKIQKLDKLPEEQYDEEYKQLAGEYILSKMDMGEEGFGDIQAANEILVVGMIKLWAGKELPDEQLKKELFELPEPDFLQLVNKVTEIQKRPLVPEKSKDSKTSSEEESTSGQSSK